MGDVFSREIMIESLIADMDHWDEEDLLGWAKEARRRLLNESSDEAIRREFNQRQGESWNVLR